jgi:hypothetical protein
MTFSCRAKIVERQIEIERHNFQVVEADSGAEICHIANATRKNAGLTSEENQNIAIDGSAGNRAPFTAISLKDFL